MTLTCCQDHILTENIWFVWSETSYSGDERRCHGCGTNDERTVKIELLSQWKLEAEFRNIVMSGVRTVLDSWHLTKVSLDAGRGLKEEKHAFLLMRPNRLKSKFEGKLSTDCPHQSAPVSSFRPMPPTVEEEYKTDNILSATFVSLTALTTCFLLEFITPSLP